jgi:hypothetical protein
VSVEAKSAGDSANTNKRRKEEVVRRDKLRLVFPHGAFVLLLGGYFERKFLQHMHGEAVPFIWEHRPEEITTFL